MQGCKHFVRSNLNMNRDDEQREERWDGGRDIFGKENINNLKGENEEKGER